MVRPILISLILALCCTGGIVAVEAAAEVSLLGGTVVSIDQQTLTVTLRMPTGEIRSFAVMDRRLLQGISIGDHVSFELNEEERITKLVKLPMDPAN
jgi:hypothetical protein